MDSKAQHILTFWFQGVDDADQIMKKNEPYKNWFIKNRRFDQQIRELFFDDIKLAKEGKYDHFLNDPKETLALVLIVDQFTRNLFRGSQEAYVFDPMAQKIVLDFLKKKGDRQLMLIERSFIYLPLMHAEDMALQELSVKEYQGLVEDSKSVNPLNTGYYEYTLKHAQEHHDTIREYGFFPHRKQLNKEKN